MSMTLTESEGRLTWLDIKAIDDYITGRSSCLQPAGHVANHLYAALKSRAEVQRMKYAEHTAYLNDVATSKFDGPTALLDLFQVALDAEPVIRMTALRAVVMDPALLQYIRDSVATPQAE